MQAYNMFWAAVSKRSHSRPAMFFRTISIGAEWAKRYPAPQGVWDPLRLKRGLRERSQLIKALRKKDQEAIWNAYKSLAIENKLSNLPAEYHTMTLQTFRFNKMITYGPEHVEIVKDRVLFVFNHMKDLQSQVDVRDYNHLIHFFGSVGDWKSCSFYWNELTSSSTAKPNTFSFNSYMRAAIQCSFPERVPEIRNDMKKFNVQPNEFTYNTMIEAYGYLGDLKEADIIYQRIFVAKPLQHSPSKRSLFQSQPTSAYSYAANAGSLARFRTPKQHHFEPTVRTFESLISAHGRQRNIDGLNHIYQVMIPAANVKPTLRTFNELIRWFCFNEDVDSARKVYTAMEAAGIQPNVVTFNHMFRLEALKNNRPKVAETLVDFMKQAHKIQPLQSMYRRLIKIHAKQNRDEEVLRLKLEMKGHQVA